MNFFPLCKKVFVQTLRISCRRLPLEFENLPAIAAGLKMIKLDPGALSSGGLSALARNVRQPVIEGRHAVSKAFFQELGGKATGGSP